jgi:outer membrane immunogenic protein
MKKLLLSASALGALAAFIAAPATAADLGVRPVPVAVWSWTGFYVGANAGGSIGVNSTTDSGVLTSSFITPGGAGPVGTNVFFNESFRHAPIGGILGGQLGYNWQWGSNIVVGLEVDWQGSWQRDTANVGACNSPVTQGFLFAGPGAFGSGFSQCLSDEQKLTNFGTARARGGVAVNESLWYVTGGLAWGTVKDNYILSTSFNPAPFVLGINPFFGGAAGFSHTKTGWTIGGGVETRLGGAWSLKLEYLYVDLGSTIDAFGVGINPAAIAAQLGAAGAAAFVAASGYTVTSSSRFSDNIFRVGLNYKMY